MEGITSQHTPRTVEDVFIDFRGRRAGLIKALTFGKFYLLSLSSVLSSFVFSDPANQKDKLVFCFVLFSLFMCRYGQVSPNVRSWLVTVSVDCQLFPSESVIPFRSQLRVKKSFHFLIV